MNFKQLKDFDFKNIDIDRNQFERITVGVIILCALSLFLVTIKTQHSIKIDGTKITYTGEFKNGSFNGQGTFKSHEGWIYQGEFKSGQADGQGKLTTENKVTYKGKFKQGIFKG